MREHVLVDLLLRGLARDPGCSGLARFFLLLMLFFALFLLTSDLCLLTFLLIRIERPKMFKPLILFLTPLVLLLGGPLLLKIIYARPYGLDQDRSSCP